MKNGVPQKDRANTGFVSCVLHRAFERTGQILRYIFPHGLVVKSGSIAYAIVSANRVKSTGIDITLRGILCFRARYSVLD